MLSWQTPLADDVTIVGDNAHLARPGARCRLGREAHRCVPGAHPAGDSCRQPVHGGERRAARPLPKGFVTPVAIARVSSRVLSSHTQTTGSRRVIGSWSRCRAAGSRIDRNPQTLCRTSSRRRTRTSRRRRIACSARATPRHTFKSPCWGRARGPSDQAIARHGPSPLCGRRRHRTIGARLGRLRSVRRTSRAGLARSGTRDRGRERRFARIREGVRCPRGRHVSSRRRAHPVRDRLDDQSDDLRRPGDAG